MPTTTEKMLSVAEVCELQPGDDQNATWINPGFTGVVRTITKKTKKAGGFFWPCVIADTTGSATIEVSFFQAPKFSEGDVIELSGSGLRRTEYNGKAQAAIGKQTEIHVVGASVHHAEQVERQEMLQPALNGTKQHIQGQTVGMAMKEAIALTAAADANPDKVDSPEFWKRVHKTASAIIRLSNALEHGNLTPALTGPSASGRADPPKAERPQPGPDRSVDTSGADQDVPF